MSEIASITSLWNEKKKFASDAKNLKVYIKITVSFQNMEA